MADVRVQKKDITGLVLAGGRATRMGGADKGLVKLNGKPLVEHVLQKLSGQCAALVISANRNLNLYRSYGYPVVADKESDFPGPLAGIAAALEIIDTNYLVVAPCDSPYLPDDYVKRLAQGLNDHPEALAAASRTPLRDQPAYMLIAKDALPQIHKALVEGRRAVYRWLKNEMHAVWVSFEDDGAFENMNSPADIEKAQSKFP